MMYLWWLSNNSQISEVINQASNGNLCKNYNKSNHFNYDWFVSLVIPLPQSYLYSHNMHLTILYLLILTIFSCNLFPFHIISFARKLAMLVGLLIYISWSRAEPNTFAGLLHVHWHGLIYTVLKIIYHCTFKFTLI